MTPTFLGMDGRGVKYYHDWDVDGGHLSVTYEQSSVIRLPWLDRFTSVASPHVDVFLGGPYAGELRKSKHFDFRRIRMATRDPRSALFNAEELAVRRVAELAGKGVWSGPRAVAILDDAHALTPDEVDRLGTLLRQGQRVGISVIICRPTRKAAPLSPGDQRLQTVLRSETEVGALRLGLMMRGRYAEDVAPNTRSAVYQPPRGEKSSFVLTSK